MLSSESVINFIESSKYDVGDIKTTTEFLLMSRYIARIFINDFRTK